MPDSHTVVAKHNRLLANVNLGDFFDPDDPVLNHGSRGHDFPMRSRSACTESFAGMSARPWVRPCRNHPASRVRLSTQRVPCLAPVKTVDSCHEGTDGVRFSAMPAARKQGGKLDLHHPILVGLLWDNRIKISQTGQNSYKGACARTTLRINSLQYRKEPNQTRAN